MQYSKILSRLAPCGLDCRRCAVYKDGEIKGLAVKLSEVLKGYGRVAKMREKSLPEFREYPSFEGVLSALTRGNCGGCRSDSVECPIACKPLECVKEKKGDFCFQCVEYDTCAGPSCSRWRILNDRMREIGIEAFYEEQLKTPRY
jgi:hypothetical protein